MYGLIARKTSSVEWKWIDKHGFAVDEQVFPWPDFDIAQDAGLVVITKDFDLIQIVANPTFFVPREVPDTPGKDYALVDTTLQKRVIRDAVLDEKTYVSQDITTDGQTVVSGCTFNNCNVTFRGETACTDCIFEECNIYLDGDILLSGALVQKCPDVNIVSGNPQMVNCTFRG